MLKKSRILSVVIILLMVLPFFTSIGEIAYAARDDFNGPQTFYLPIGGEEKGLEHNNFKLLSQEDNEFVGEYEFKDDLVKVFINREVEYPMFGRIPIPIKLISNEEYTLGEYNTEFTITLTNELGQISSDEYFIEDRYYYEDGRYIYVKYIIAYFPETVGMGEYEISLKVEDVEDIRGFDIGEELAEEEELAKEEELAEEDELVEQDELVDEEELEDETIYSFETEFVSISLKHKEIIEEDEIIIIENDVSLYIRDMAIGGDVEAQVIDNKGNIIYKTTNQIGRNHELMRDNYRLREPIYMVLPDYYVYSGHINLYKVNNANLGRHTLELMLNGEKIYTKEINLVEKHPIIKGVQVDKYLFEGDNEFKIEVHGSYLTRKDLLDLEVMDSKNNVVAKSSASDYRSFSNHGQYVDVLYLMEVEPGFEIKNHERYEVKLKYSGPEELVIKTDYVHIQTIASARIGTINKSRINEGILILEGGNLSEENEYLVEINIDNEPYGEFPAKYINSRELHLSMGDRIINGRYDISIYEIKPDPYGHRSNIGWLYFSIDKEVEDEVAYPELNSVNPAIIPYGVETYFGDIYGRNFIPKSIEDINIKLIDVDENVVGEVEIFDYHVSNGNVWTYFEVSINNELEEDEAYYYIYEYNNKEIKDRNNNRLSTLMTGKTVIESIYIENSTYDDEIGVSEDVNFILENAVNIVDLDKLDVYIEDDKGVKIATLVEESLEENPYFASSNYIGKLKFTSESISKGKKRVIVSYDGEIVKEKEVEVIIEPFVGNIRQDRLISLNAASHRISLRQVLNINNVELDIRVVDLLGNEVNVEIEDMFEHRMGRDGLGIKNVEIDIKFNEPLHEGYYRLYLNYKGIDLYEKIATYDNNYFCTTNQGVLTGSSYSRRFEIGDMSMQITYFTEAVNIVPGEKYKGYFYLYEDRFNYYSDIEFVGCVDLISGEEHGNMGIKIPPEAFVDYPEGEYELFIEKENGELLGRSYFRIDNKSISIPEETEISFMINDGSDYTNNSEVVLKINSKDYKFVKIGNTEEELENAEAQVVENSMVWNLSEGDGEKNVYIQLLDDDGSSSKILWKSIILDTQKPILSEVSVRDDSGIVIGDYIYLSALGNERGNLKLEFYLNNIEVDKRFLAYSGREGELYRYSDYIEINKEIDKIVAYLEDYAGNKSDAEVINIEMSNAVNLRGTLYRDENKVAYHAIYLERKNSEGYFEPYKSVNTNRLGEYDFGDIAIGQYRLVSYPMRGYKGIEKEISLTMDLNQDLRFERISTSFSNLIVGVKNNKGLPLNNANIVIYGYGSNINESKITDVDGKVTFFNLPSGSEMQYDVAVYVNGYSESRLIQITRDDEIEFTVPDIKTLEGKVTIGPSDEGVRGAEIILRGEGQYYYTETNEDGYYSINIMDGIEYNLSIRHPLYTSEEYKILPNVTEYNIKLSDRVRVFGTLRDSTGNPLANKSIYASGKNDWQNVKTDQNGEYELKLGIGKYTISHEWMQDYISEYKNIEISDSDSIEVNFVLDYINNHNAFNGEGNNVKADKTIIQRGKTINVVSNYRNNSYKMLSGEVKVDLPEGLELVAGKSKNTFNNLKRGESGKLVLTIKVLDSYEGDKIIIPSSVMVEGEEYNIGFAEIDVIDITITAPELVPDGNFKVYGETTPGANVTIIDKISNEVLARSRTSGRWYSADIKDLPEGEYEIFARSEKDGEMAISQSTLVKVDFESGVKVLDVEVTTPGGQKVGINHEIGVSAFTAWTDLNLQGNDIEISVDLSKDVDNVKYIFAGKEYAAYNIDGRWETTLTGWGGSGTRQIVLEVTIGGTTIKMVVGEVIILIDPSGYVYDDITGERIEGATVTCEILEDGNWVFWNAEDYGQINPQITDENGEYGWMVPEGIFRVKVDKEGYESKVVGNDKSIIIPPPRTDVNIALISLEKTYIDVVKTGFYISRELGNRFIDIYGFLNQKLEYLDIINETGLKNVLFVHQNGKGSNLEDMLEYGISSFATLTEDDFELGYKDMGRGINIKPTLGLNLVSADLANGRIDVKFKGAGEEPILGDFEITQSINGSESIPVTVISMDWFADIKKLVLNINKIEDITEEMYVEYNIKYQGKEIKVNMVLEP